MKEDFLVYVWQHQYFDKKDLGTATQEAVQVYKTGFRNTNAGPDFLDAQVKIGQETWSGSVEIHLKASDWLKHQHQLDTRYDQVILHVVWENDQPLHRTDGTPIPVIELKNRVAPALLQTYLNLKSDPHLIPCTPFLAEVPEITKLQMLDRVLLERLEHKGSLLTEQLGHHNQHWEEITYQAIAANFGFKINKEPFHRLSKALPYAILRRHRQQLFQLEALLFGQAGFLTEEYCQDEYLDKLRQEFGYLKHKYALPAGLQKADWNSLRLRPANFPTVRLAQLAAFLHNKDYLFSALLESETIPSFINFFSAPVSPYWQTHYMPARPLKTPVAGIGKDSIYLIIINTVIPLLYAYARSIDNQNLIDKALALLENIPAEHNAITKIYQQLNFRNKSAQDSQAFLQLNQQYCAPRQCLLCSIGHYILKKQKPAP
ncbi:hypothetical protein AAE02nite_35110 [Adhaeribacter aerolatus]|uniref:DUF2851 domain-containing protein n=1 Tax=Adhaeribacter aerolatus TaxID=670289 RepID=A0A512B220_9BACT|nr:DUF2851 family protein [Adhaeribacter aerolatus]GEO05847.1 hypothetical protein AAE02nite_35110 [Adhaeribacter aerolatus]